MLERAFLGTLTMASILSLASACNSTSTNESDNTQSNDSSGTKDSSATGDGSGTSDNSGESTGSNNDSASTSGTGNSTGGDSTGDDDDDDTQTGDSSSGDDTSSGDTTTDGDACGSGDAPSGLKISGDIPTWKNGAKGAYTIFHDDTCWDHGKNAKDEAEGIGSHFSVAAPELEKRGLIGAFGMVAAGCDGWEEANGKFEKADWDNWEQIDTLAAAGHELVNHSFAHITVTDASYDMSREIGQANMIFRDKVKKYPIDFYIFPEDLSDSKEIDELKKLDYLGARTGTKGGMNMPDALDAFHLNYDVHATPTGVGKNPHQQVELDDYVDQAISSGGYAIREFHAVVDEDPGGDETTWVIMHDEYNKHLDHVEEKAKSGELWVAGPAQVIRYLTAKSKCPAPSYKDGVISWKDLSDDCKRNSEFLSYPVTVDGSKKLAGEQSGHCFESVENDGKVYLNLNPSLGDAKVWEAK